MDKDSDKRKDINSDENADWIKNIPDSDSNVTELEIHRVIDGNSRPRPPAPQA